MSTTYPQGHNMGVEGDWTRLWCGHTVPGYLPYDKPAACPTCEAAGDR